MRLTEYYHMIQEGYSGEDKGKYTHIDVKDGALRKQANTHRKEYIKHLKSKKRQELDRVERDLFENHGIVIVPVKQKRELLTLIESQQKDLKYQDRIFNE